MNVSEQIEKYLKNEMGEDERTFFEARVNTDADLKKELEDTTAIYASFDRLRETEFKDRFKILDQNDKIVNSPQEIPSVNKERKTWRALKWAASIAIIAITAWLIFFQQSASTEQLYAQYYNAYPNIVVPVERSESGDVSEEDAVWILYEQNEFNEAFEIFEDMMSLNPENDQIAFYYAICALELNRDQVALYSFSRISSNPASAFNQQSEWYLALTYLKLSDRSKAMQEFQEISIGEGVYKQRAMEILNKLN